MSGHTPGPWIVAFWGGKVQIRPDRPAQGFTVGFSPLAVVMADKRLIDRETHTANALLFAAAPDLLTVARMAEQVALMELGEAGHVEFSPREFLAAVRAAIAKATGDDA